MSALPEAEKKTPERSSTIYTAADGIWRVAIRLNNGQHCITDPTKYASEASATLAAIRSHHAKPSLNYMAVRA